MRGNGADERWAQPNSDNGVKEELEEEEEALSLCDLPVNETEKQLSGEELPEAIESEEDFNFCSGAGDSLCKESEMCAADEVFYQGQILPLRNSVSSEVGFIKLQSESGSMSRCESMDHSYSCGLTSVSSRSSSINSHHSSSSGGSSGTTATTTATASSLSKHKPRSRVGNQFQYSHPSPKPQIRPSSIANKNGNLGNSNRKSALWSLFRVGLVTTPEIAIQDLKNRTNNNNNNNNNNKNISPESFVSRNSSTNSNDKSKTMVEKKKNKQFFLEKTGVLFGNCKCSANAIGTVPSRVAVIRRSASAKDAEDEEKQQQHHAMEKTNQQQAGKQSLSRHRTFAWLKQLSLLETAAIDES